MKTIGALLTGYLSVVGAAILGILELFKKPKNEQNSRNDL